MSPTMRGKRVSSMRMPTAKPYWLKPPRTRPAAMRPYSTAPPGVQAVEIAVVELGDRVARCDGQHAVELALGEREAAQPDVLVGVFADDGPHAQIEILGVLDTVGLGGRRGVRGLQEPAGGLDALLEPRVAAEEEGLHRATVLAFALEHLEDLGRLRGVVTGADESVHASLVRLPLQVAPVAIDRRDGRQRQAEPQDRVGRLAQHRGAHLIAGPRPRSRGHGDADAGGDGSDRVEDLLGL